jgi:hypothetical protein
MTIGQTLLPLLFLPLATGTANQSSVRPVAQPVELTRNAYHVDVRIGGQPLTTYSLIHRSQNVMPSHFGAHTAPLLRAGFR